MRWQRIVFSVTVTEGLVTEVSEKRKGCGRKAIPVKSNMVYTLCKHMVYMLSITNEHKK